MFFSQCSVLVFVVCVVDDGESSCYAFFEAFFGVIVGFEC
jgi:hypothetical protein